MDQGCHPYPSRDASLTARGASLNLIPIPNPFKILPLGMMFRFGNYNNLKCGRGGFGVRACPLKAPLVKHCTSKKAQSGRTAAQRGRTAAQRGRTAVQLLFLQLDTFWWEQHSAGSISSAGTKVLLATRSSGHFLCKRLSHLHCSAPGLALVTLFARIHDNAPSVNGNCCATASLTFQNIALSTPFCWQHISAGATLAPFLVYASWQAVGCFTARACF